MPVTYNLIASNTLSSSAASVTFSAIPNTYTDLVLKTSLRDTVSGAENAGMRLTFNSSGTGYSMTNASGSGVNVFSGRESSTIWIKIGQQPAATATANTFSNDEIYIPNYLASANKPVGSHSVGENNNTVAYQYIVAGLWQNTAAITSLTIQSNSTAWASGSSFFLYGIKNS